MDERDSAWEDDSPRFRVYVQTAVDGQESASTTTYDLTGYDFVEVLDWARGRAAIDEVFAIALVVDDDTLESVQPRTGRGLVWLQGHDRNSR